MRRERISEVIGSIDQKYVDEATACIDVKTVRRSRWMRWCVATASVAAALLAGIFLLPQLSGKNAEGSLLGGLIRPYGQIKVGGSEIDIEWPWEEKMMYERYQSMTFSGEEYRTRAKAISQLLLGEVIGSCEAEGYDTYTDKIYRQTFEVRCIVGVSEKRLVAVDMDGEFYVFMCDEYDPPATFGELTESYGMAETLEFSRFTVYEGSDEKGHFKLEEDDTIRQILSGCREAEFVKDDSWNRSDRNYISFTVTSEALGAYKKAVYVTEDGYVWTNVFDWSYLYYIGKEATGQIIAYATENGVATEMEPYSQSLAGTVVEIGEDYLLVDDSILCENPEDGIVFKVPANDLRIRRYIDNLKLEVGDTVAVQFTGVIDVEDGNVVNGAYALTEATIAGGDVWVAE